MCVDALGSVFAWIVDGAFVHVYIKRHLNLELHVLNFFSMLTRLHLIASGVHEMCQLFITIVLFVISPEDFFQTFFFTAINLIADLMTVIR